MHTIKECPYCGWLKIGNDDKCNGCNRTVDYVKWGRE